MSRDYVLILISAAVLYGVGAWLFSMSQNTKQPERLALMITSAVCIFGGLAILVFSP